MTKYDTRENIQILPCYIDIIGFDQDVDVLRPTIHSFRVRNQYLFKQSMRMIFIVKFVAQDSESTNGVYICGKISFRLKHVFLKDDVLKTHVLVLAKTLMLCSKDFLPYHPN